MLYGFPKHQVDGVGEMLRIMMELAICIIEVMAEKAHIQTKDLLTLQITNECSSWKVCEIGCGWITTHKQAFF